jgi:hypothetical protein
MARKIPTDPDTFFREFFPEQYANNPQFYPRSGAGGASVIEVFGHGVWNFRVHNGKLEVGTGVPEDAFLRLGLSYEDFRAVYVARSQREIDAEGDLSSDSKNVFRPMFPTEQRWEIVRGNRGTISIRLQEGDEVYTLVATPGADEPTEPRAVVRLSLADFLGMTAGRLKATALLVDGRLKIKGDLAHALKLNALLL